MDITSTRIRFINNSKYIAIASVTLDNELIINDIRVVANGKSDIRLIFPCSERALSRRQYNILPDSELYKRIKKAIFFKLKKEENQWLTGKELQKKIEINMNIKGEWKWSIYVLLLLLHFWL